MTRTRAADHTGAQVTAADPTQSVWVSANAGTGKTHVLIERILRLLLAGTAPGRILCLTYTKAAAAEAANRLSERLGHWAAANKRTLAKDLKDLLGRSATDDEAGRARALFALTLESPEGVTIRTIHSFCESLLGRFPVEAGIAPHFTVIDEGLAREIRAEAEARLLADQAGRPAAVTEALARLAGLVDQDGFAKLMNELDSKRGRLARMLETEGGVAGIMARLRAEMGLGEKDTVETVHAAAAADGAFDRAGLERTAAALDEGSASDKDRAAAIRAWLALEPAHRAEAFEDAYREIFVTQQGEPRKTVATKKVQDADPDAADALAAEQERVVAVLARLRSLRLAEATEALLTVGETLIEAYEAAKRARALLDYDDLIEKAAALLADDKGVSWVHYKLDGGIDHILVDEAQDTGPDSWEVIWRLSGDFFAGLGAGAGERPLERTVFAVGDEKQSIYSFQGADPARFGAMRERYQHRIGGAGGRLQDVALAVSYRSTVPVLKVVDAVFANPEAADGLTWDDEPIRHATHRPRQGGLVELWPVLTPEEEPERLPWDAPVDQMAPQSPPARLAERIAATIARWRRDGEVLESAGRPIEPGDILILVRARRAFADRMVRALERRGIPVTGRDRLRLLDHLAVMDLVAAGRFALLPENDLNTATVLKGPFVGFGDEALFALAHGRKTVSLWQALRRRRDESPAFARGFQVLSALLGAADMARPYEFFSGLLARGGRRELLARLGAEAAEPIDEFMAQTLAFEREHEPSLEGFLHWLERGEIEVKREMERGRNEVRVLTVHGAKGLEAPIVFLPDTCALPSARLDDPVQWRTDDSGGGFALWRMRTADEDDLARAMREAARDETMREHRRLLYVAMTRARDRLYVAGFEGKRPRPEGCWYDLVAPVIRKLGTEVALAGGEAAWRYETPQKARPDGAARPAAGAGKARPPAWATRPPKPEPEPSRPLAPSAPADEDPPVLSPLGPDRGARYKRGIVVHRLLQGLPAAAPADRKALARAYLERPGLGLRRAEADDILAETLAVLADPALAPLFGPGSLAEVPVTGEVRGRGGPRVLLGQVDRLLVTDDAVTVADYKTNRPPPETENDVDPRYLRQMAAYREALRGVYPGRRVTGILVWTAGPRAMALSDGILDAHAP